MQYTISPKEISMEDIVSNNCSFSPLDYRGVKIKNTNIKTVGKLLDGDCILGNEVGSLAYIPIESPYKFLRTKSLQKSNFQLNLNTPNSYEYIKPIDYLANKGKNEEKIIKEGDLLFVTGGNVGEVAIAQSLGNTIFSSHIARLPISKNKLYLFAFLKSGFGKEQANFGPIGSIGGLDTFTIDTLQNIKIPFPNQVDKENIVEYVEVLVQAINNKEKEIRRKDRLIFDLIENELLDNQKPNKFRYEYPNIKEISKMNSRLETGMYSKEFKEMDFLLENYMYGYQRLSDLGYIISRGQNLQVSSIGRSVYSETHQKGFYRLALSKNFSEYATVDGYRYIENPKELKQIEQGDILFSCRGARFGRVSIFCDEVDNTITNIDNVHISNRKQDMKNKIFICLFLNYLREKGHLHRIAITGSGANSLTQYQFDLLKFPNFQGLKLEGISKLHYNPITSDYFEKTNLETFLVNDQEWNRDVGVIQLDQSIKKIKERLDKVIHKIVMDEEVLVDFTFLT